MGKRRRGGRGGSATPPPQQHQPYSGASNNSQTGEAGSTSNDANDMQPAGNNKDTENGNNSNQNGSSAMAPDLVLTSEKKRGVYECDYCHSDISQLPRIRCAVCPDFDLCLDCFATTDHTAAVARIKAAATAHSELKADGITSTSGVMSTAAVNHRDDHGYRVCDSTRYPIFASTRSVKGLSAEAALMAASTTVTPTPTRASTPIPKPQPDLSAAREAENDGKNMDGTDEAAADIPTIQEDTKNDEKEEGAETKEKKGEEKSDMMDVDPPEKEEKNEAATATTATTAAAAAAAAATPASENKMEESTKSETIGGTDEKATTPPLPQEPPQSTTTVTKNNIENLFVISDDPKTIWTAEEDLRLIDAIKTHGLGNWGEIAESVSGNGSVGKTARRCMERYFDDYLGRYGHILPQYIVVDDTNTTTADDNNGNNNDNTTASATGGDPQEQGQTGLGGEDEAVRTSKRKHAIMMRSNSSVSATSSLGGRGGGLSKKRYKVAPTESLPEYKNLWPEPYLPPIPGAIVGQEVARDLSSKAELSFVKAISAVQTKEEAEKIRKEYMESKLNQIGAPTVLPPRPEDSESLPGADLVGFMPRRGDFDIEWENDAEAALADMEFLQSDTQQDKDLKLQVLDIYYQKQEEREKRKKFILSRNLFDYRKHVKDEEALPADERDLVHRMRLFERFHTPQEHKQFIDDILKAKRLRKEIAKLQMYRRIGIRSLAEAEMYELDKKRRQFHKEAQSQKDGVKGGGSSKANNPTTLKGGSASVATTASQSRSVAEASTPKDSLWKQYRPSDRKARRSINRAGSTLSDKQDDAKKSEETNEEEKSSENKEAIDSSKQDEAKGQESEETTKVDSSKGQGGTEKEPEDKSDIVKSDENENEKAEDKEDKQKNQDDAAAVVGNESNTTGEKDEKMEDEATAPEQDGKMDVDKEEKGKEEVVEEEAEEEFDISQSKGYDLLSRRETALCVRLTLWPSQYLEIKKALIYESLNNGLLETGSNGRHNVVKIDVERRGNILDFMVRAGWISSTLASTAKSLPGGVAATQPMRG